MFTPMQFEELTVKSEIKHTPEFYILLVEIPDGFTRENIGAKVEYDFGRVRIYGERQLDYNRRGHFNEVYPIPPYCDISNIKGKFDGKTVTISMLIKDQELYQQIKKQEEEEAERIKAEAQRKQEEEAAKRKQEEEEEAKRKQEEEEAKRKQEEEEAERKKAEAQRKEAELKKVEAQQKEQEEEAVRKEAEAQQTEEKQNIPPQSAVEVKDQKGQGVSDKDPKSEVESKQEDSKKDAIIKAKSKKQADQESSTPPQEEIPQKAEVTKDAKLQTEEKSAELDDENKKKEKIGKEETKELPKEAEGTLVGDDSVRKIGKAVEPDLTTMKTRIKEMAGSTSQAVTSLVKKFNEEDKQKLIYMGAAVVVVGLGVYASYKLRSSRRP